MKNKYPTLIASLGVAVLLLMSAASLAADEWFELSQQTIKSVDQGVELKSEGGRWKTKVKQIKISVEGADVEITKAFSAGTIAPTRRSRILES